MSLDDDGKKQLQQCFLKLHESVLQMGELLHTLNDLVLRLIEDDDENDEGATKKPD